MASKAEQAKWQAEEDAYTLSRAAEVMSDTKRMTAAKKVADKMANDQAKKAEALKKVAKGQVVKVTPKRAAKRVAKKAAPKRKRK